MEPSDTIPPMPPPSFPMIPVLFCYIDGGIVQKKFHAMSSSVPRAGELVAPQAGSASLMVHTVIYRVEMMPNGVAGAHPIVYLRELTDQEKKEIGSICVS